jgi:hypothetical protein
VSRRPTPSWPISRRSRTSSSRRRPTSRRRSRRSPRSDRPGRPTRMPDLAVGHVVTARDRNLSLHGNRLR